MEVQTQQASDAFLNAGKIARAVEKKLVKFKVVVREVKTPEFSYIEIVLQPPNTSPSNEIVTAYSSAFYEVKHDDPEVVKQRLQAKAKRILNDFKISLGLPKEA